MKSVCLKIPKYIAVVLFESRVYHATCQFLGIVDNLLPITCQFEKSYVIFSKL